jgi:hypothetical protein
VIQVKAQGLGRSTFFTTAIAIVLIITCQPISVAIDVPVPIEVKLEDPEPVVVLESNESVTAVLNGSIETNYPGVELSISLGATCGALTTQVSPSEMKIRGVTVRFFEITVLIPSNITSGAGLYGRLLYSVLYTYPGGSAAATSSQTFVITVLRNNTINQTQEAAPMDPKKPDSHAFLDTICAMQVLLSVPIGLSIYYFHRHRKVRTPRTKALN